VPETAEHLAIAFAASPFSMFYDLPLPVTQTVPEAVPDLAMGTYQLSRDSIRVVGGRFFWWIGNSDYKCSRLFGDI